jgi:ribosomal protein L11 methyltransferase
MITNNYIVYKFVTTPENAEILTALIAEFPFEVFEEKEDGFEAFLKEKDDSDDLTTYLAALQDTFDFTYQKNVIVSENWNIAWESNFHPIQIDDFCAIRADFHAPIPDIQYELIINPKMAFGTGHHETTHLAIQYMQTMNFEDKKVLDFGSGTGVLSILASKIGAKDIVAVDNEVPAYESTIENATINGVANIRTVFGVLDDVKEGDFDIILANINRNVITNALDLLHQKINKNGFIVTSGFLIADRTIILEAMAAKNFEVVMEKSKGDWLCLLLQQQS